MIDETLDFDLLFEPDEKGDFRTIVVNSPAGQASGRFRPIADLELENFWLRMIRSRELRRRAGDLDQIRAVSEFGATLFDEVFTADVGAAYRRSAARALELSANLRIRLRFAAAPELQRFPWEMLYDPIQSRFLSLSATTPVIRYVEAPPVRARFVNQLRMLVVVSSPTDLSTIDVEREWVLVQESISRGTGRDVELGRIDPDVSALQRSLRREEWNVLLFIGKAASRTPEDDAGLVFQDDRGSSRYVSYSDLGVLLRDVRLQLVILDAAGDAASSDIAGAVPQAVADGLVRAGVPAVIATSAPLGDEARAVLLGTLLGALTDGEPIERALGEARKALYTDGDLASALILTLHTRLADMRLLAEKSLPETVAQTGRSVLEELSRPPGAALAPEILRLEGCTSLSDVAAVHRFLSAPEWGDAESAALRSFSRVSRDVDAALGQSSRYNQRLALGAVEDRLDGLIRELALGTKTPSVSESPEAAAPRRRGWLWPFGRNRDAGGAGQTTAAATTGTPFGTRLQSVAASWRTLVADHLQALAVAVEDRQEIDSPYLIGVPLTPQQALFVGRSDASARIEELLADQRRPPMLLYGQRRMGKTSLLNNLERLLSSTTVSTYVDLQGPPTQASDHAGFLYNLARLVVDAAARSGLPIPRLIREHLSKDPFTSFDEWLDQVESALGDRSLLLMLDEFETLDRAFAQGRFDEDRVLGMFRHLIQHRPRVKILLAGSHLLDEMQRWANYLINVQVVHLSYLGESETRRLVEHPVEGFALRYDAEAVNRVIALTRGHPFLVQLLCGEIVALKNEQPDLSSRRQATVADVEAAARYALSTGQMFFHDIQTNQVNAVGVSVLHEVAAQGPGAVVTASDLHHSAGGQTDAVLDGLVRRELLERTPKGVRFQVELVRRWFA